MMERWREMWGLPKDVLSQIEDAIAAEVWWHIFDVFGYETGVLEEEDLDLLYKMFVHESVNCESELYKPAACRAFVRFVTVSGGPEVFALSDQHVSEWVPTEAPFSAVSIDDLYDSYE
jgi:hypothetical protein